MEDEHVDARWIEDGAHDVVVKAGGLFDEDDAEFIAASRTEGPWAAQKLLEALDEIERLRQIADAASEVLTDVGVSEKHIAVNRKAAEALGRTLLETGYWQYDEDGDEQ